MFSLNAHSAHESQSTASVKVGFPLSDPENGAGWVLNNDISDEFNAGELDTSKWFVEGEQGDYYIWKGRPPSQFAPHNVLVEDGKLKIRTQWEPDFDFANENYADGSRNDAYGRHEGEAFPVTTGAAISRKRFLNGYMEVRTKAGDAAMTSSFWTIGYQSELDIYEQMGKPSIAHDITATNWKASVHDWRPPAKRPTRKFGMKEDLGFRVADEFHVYGAEWGEDYLKLYLDGELKYEVTQEEVGRHWVLTNPLEIWFDSEIFVWLGLPRKDELPVDYEIDYVRVWQKPHANLLARHFYGFEGPYLYEGQSKPLDLTPENPTNNAYQKFWQIHDDSSQHLAVVRHEHHSAGTRSLRFESRNRAATAIATTPAGTLALEPGSYTLKAKLWLEPGSQLDGISIQLNKAKLGISLDDTATFKPGQWHTIEQKIMLDEQTSNTETMSITFVQNEAGADTRAYLDEISIEH
ncbi:family 16 glycosylhydrolase [Gilvimarinus agarilyticus]|nr:family 16 glycosylhydrolase [Gilvimarinus agarilyticus]